MTEHSEPTRAELVDALDALRRMPTGVMKTKSTPDGIAIEIDYKRQTPRRCGSCTLCCRLLPIAQFESPAGHVCPHQRMGQGCRIYATRPIECASWSCRWLMAPEETAGMRRPDRAHYAIDPLFDEIRAGEVSIPALQVWCDPHHRELVEDPELRAYIEGLHQQHGLRAVILRWNNEDSTPLIRGDEGWVVVRSRLNRQIGNYSRLPTSMKERLR